MSLFRYYFFFVIFLFFFFFFLCPRDGANFNTLKIGQKGQINSDSGADAIVKTIVDTRLNGVADKLNQLQAPKAPAGGQDDIDDEDELLKSDTPAPSPPGTPSEPKETSPTSNGAGDVVMAVPVDTNASDAIADRVEHIFLKRGASESLETDSKPKVSNTGEYSSAEEDFDAIPGIPIDHYESDVLDSDPEPVQEPVDKSKDDSNAIEMDVGDDDSTPAGGNNAIVEEVEDAEDGEWPEDNDQPEAYPDIAFPMAPPSYPRQPDFEYRYRAGHTSTPQRRRVDFTKAIVLRQCRRDPYTGRISQEEYDAREDAEMMISLGYVPFHFAFLYHEIQHQFSLKIFIS